MVRALAHLSAALLALALHCAAAATTLTLPPISASPTNASQILDRRLASFSIEFSYLPSFGGNASHPNLLTQELMQRLVERTGVGPDVRPGGITMSVGLNRVRGLGGDCQLTSGRAWMQR
jgi:hypothetical protein